MNTNIGDHSKIYITIAVAGLAMLSCSLVSGLIPNRGEEATRQVASERPVALTPPLPRTPGAETPVAPAWPEDAPPPADLENIYTAGLGHGYWNEGEGLLRMLRFFMGLPEPGPVPGLDQLPMIEVNWLLIEAQTFVTENRGDPNAEELEAILQTVLPPEEDLRRYSVPFESTAFRGSSPIAHGHRPHRQPDCSGLWIDGFPEPTDADESLSCFRVISQAQGGQTMDVLLPQSLADDPSWETNAQAVGEAMLASYEAFQVYGDMPSATAIFVPWTVESPSIAAAAGSAARAADEWDSCPLLFFPTTGSQSSEALQWSTAHQMFHCFQAWNYGSFHLRALDSRWWTEGSAVYFSNFVYPDYSGKHGYLPHFDADSLDRSLPAMSHAGYVLFHYLSSVRSNHWLVSALGELPSEAPLVEHQRTLADHVPQDVFHRFGQLYLEGEIRDTPVTSGDYIPIEASLGATIDIAQATTMDLQAPAFVLRRHRLEYDSDKRFVQRPKTEGPGEMSVRPDLSLEWGQVRPEVRSFCYDPASVLLLTTTEVGDPYQVSFELAQVDDVAWEMTTSDGEILSGNQALYRNPAAGRIITLSGSQPDQGQPSFTLSTTNVHFLEIDGDEYVARGRYTVEETAYSALSGEFSLNFWTDVSATLQGGSPEFSGRGWFEACPAEAP